MANNFKIPILKFLRYRILVNEFDSILRPAMTTKNTIETAVIDNVMFIPIEALFSNDTISYVFLKDGRSAKKQQVIAGQSNENEIIIKAGLKADDEVLMNTPENGEEMRADHPFKRDY